MLYLLNMQKSILIENLDQSVSPKEDFFEYANGGWLKKNPIPLDRARWSSFDFLHDENEKRLLLILDDLKNDQALSDPDFKKVRDFYRASMDEEKVARDGLTPLLPFVENARKMERESIINTILSLYKKGVGTLLSISVEQDDADALRYVPIFSQPSLGLPDRDYYLVNTEAMQTVREKYKKYLSDLFVLVGREAEEAALFAEKIFTLEKSLAEVFMTNTDMRDPYKIYNKKTFADLVDQFPSINWKQFYTDAGIKEGYDVIVLQPDVLKYIENLILHEPIETLRILFEKNIFSALGGTVSRKIEELNFDFYGRTLAGLKEQRPRFKRMASLTDQSLGFALGRIYVERYFSENAKKKMTELVGNIMSVMEDHIRKAPWMTTGTKEKALNKVKTFVTKLGYPDVWEKYDNLVVGDTYMTNCTAVAEYEWDKDMKKLGQPIDRTEWGMTPPTVNAYYSPNKNEIVFPAGILQAPFFDEECDDAENYGGIGSVIAHEITHAFDDQGGQYDAYGNLKEWWTEEDKKEFTRRAENLVDQFNLLSPIPGLHINGSLTLGENIADLGGVVLAHEAYMKTISEEEKNKTINGITPEQRFFIRFAHCECGHTREEAARQRLLTDPHSPSKERVNAILPNFGAFYDAFDIKEADPMYLAPEKRTEIW